jgi:PAS domain S-box-containing protein
MKKVDPILKPLKNTNATLQAQVNFQRQIIQSTEAIIIVLDANTTIKSISKGAEKILGFSSKELVNKKWFETLVIKNTLKEHQTKFKEFLSSNKKYREGLVPVICKDGSIKKINWKTNKIFEQKKLIGTVALGKDVTAYEERVDVLKESEKKFRDLAELLPTAISCKTTDNKIIFLNKAYTQQFGYTLKDITDFDAWLQVAYKNNADSKKADSDWKNAVAILKSGKKTKTSLITVYNKKNEKRILKHDTTLSGKNIYCSYYDVTEEVEKENKLKANEIKFRKLAEQMQHPVVFVNINGEFVFLNKAFAKQFGFNIKDFPNVASIINHMNINATEKNKVFNFSSIVNIFNLSLHI